MLLMIAAVLILLGAKNMPTYFGVPGVGRRDFLRAARDLNNNLKPYCKMNIEKGGANLPVCRDARQRGGHLFRYSFCELV
jgi:Sec-independent protein translocase protein TatA